MFNFPSRYLSSIDITFIFSLRWSLPSDFGLHSQETLFKRDLGMPNAHSSYGPHTLSGQLETFMRT